MNDYCSMHALQIDVILRWKCDPLLISINIRLLSVISFAQCHELKFNQHTTCDFTSQQFQPLKGIWCDIFIMYS